MGAKHTPGPWQVNHDDPTQVCDADGEVRGCSPIAYCTVGTMDERKANAKLIAAAPRMVKALQQCMREFEAYYNSPGSGIDLAKKEVLATLAEVLGK
jgi:hypothetical protein